jgi:hypothetical protein
MDDFLSEEDLQTFEGWLRYQAVSPTSAADRELWRRAFEEARQRTAAAPKVGLMKLQPAPGQHLYAVALRQGDDLWLTLWVRRSWKGEVFVMLPRGDRDWDVHTSYHLDGTLHTKSHGRTVFTEKCQPPTGTFRGAQSVCSWSGHAGPTIGAVCDPSLFSGVVEVPPRVLGPRDGAVAVDLVEPGHEPVPMPWRKTVVEHTFLHTTPWLVIRVGIVGLNEDANPPR